MEQGNHLSKMGKFLGWFSLGLGAAETIAPGAVCRMAGLPPREGLMRTFGLREIASGVGVFGSNPSKAFWARVAGDMMDLGCLAKSFGSPWAQKGRLALATASVLGCTAMDYKCARNPND